QTLNTVFASGDKMDLFFALQFVRYGYVKNKIYTPITQEMLDQYGPNIKKAWTQETWDYLKDADGNYVGIPRNGVLRNYPTWIRTDWLEKYGLAMPTTVEELEEVLQVFHEKKPAGPGTIPLLTGASDSLNHLRYALMGGWVEPGYHKDGGWLDTDGKIKPAELHPGFQDFLAKMNEWYEKGYLFKESFTMNNGALRKLMQTGKCGVVSYWGSGIGIGYEVIKEVDPEAVYVAAPGIKGPAGFIETIQTPADSGWMIYRDSEYPIEILKAIDFQYSSFEQYLVSELGIKDKQWKWADEEQKVYEQIGDRKYFQEYRYAPGLYMEIQGIMKGGREFWVKHMR
ncbi:MAG: extracellular solute-binding protein, partial [Bacteroidetes bacterium]|nr:extracellular solute-binding protein [Bacteroidota bacterium]